MVTGVINFIVQDIVITHHEGHAFIIVDVNGRRMIMTFRLCHDHAVG